MGLHPVCETGLKAPFKQPAAGIVLVTGCLVSFRLNTGIVVISNLVFDDGGRRIC